MCLSYSIKQTISCKCHYFELNYINPTTNLLYIQIKLVVDLNVVHLLDERKQFHKDT